MLPPLDTLPEWRDEHPTLGYQVEDWSMGVATATSPAAPAARFLVPAGPLAGRPFSLTDRQLTFLLWWYALDDDGLFLMRGASMRHARGTGKSPLAAFIGVCELVGPVRFSHWDGDEPVGTRASMPLVQVAAVSEAQCENTQQYVRAWTAKGTPLQLEYGLDPGKQIVYAPGDGRSAGGKLAVITSSSATARGATPSLVLADETGEWTDANGGTRFRAVLGDNAAKVASGRVLECANSWRPGDGSVAELRWDAWTAEQEAGGADRPWLMDVREAPADTDWEDPDSIHAAVEAVYEPVPWMSAKQVMPQILDRAKPINESMREFGNLRVSELTSWVSSQDWDACAVDDDLRDSDEVVLFCDASESDDATALVACRVGDGLVAPLWIFEPNAVDPVTGRPFGPVPLAELDRQVLLAFERFTVLAFFSDVHPIEQYAKVEWRDRYEDQLVIWATAKEPVAFDMRGNKQEFAQAAELAADEVAQTARARAAGDELDEHALRHTGDSVLTRHVYNTQREPYRQYVSVRKGDHRRKIDGAVATIGARHARRRLLTSKEYERWLRRRSGRGRVIVLS